MPQAWTIDTPFFLLAIYTPDMKPLKTTHLFFVNTEFFCLVKTVTFDGLFFARGLGREEKTRPRVTYTTQRKMITWWIFYHQLQ